MGEKKANFTQLTHMVDYILGTIDITNNDIMSRNNRDDFNKCWQDLSCQLNGLGKCIKDVDNWKMTWKNLKSNTKKKVARQMLDRHRTGGEYLSDLENKVLFIIGKDSISGLDGVRETVTVEPSISEDDLYNFSSSKLSISSPQPPIYSLRQAPSVSFLKPRQAFSSISLLKPPQASSFSPLPSGSSRAMPDLYPDILEILEKNNNILLKLFESMSQRQKIENERWEQTVEYRKQILELLNKLRENNVCNPYECHFTTL